MNDVFTGATTAMVLTDMPLGVTIGRKHFQLFPQTLGRMYLTSQLIEKIEVNHDNLKANAFMEALRVAGKHRYECCQLIAYYTLRSKKSMLDARAVNKRTREIQHNADNEDIATLIITILSDNKLDEISKNLGLDKEGQRMAKISKARDSKNQYVFGGRTVWGSLIDAACERYGWVFDYVVWGISYNNLSLMLKDKITSIYLSDEERRKAHIPPANEQSIDGNNREEVMRMVKESEENPE